MEDVFNSKLTLRHCDRVALLTPAAAQVGGTRVWLPGHCFPTLVKGCWRSLLPRPPSLLHLLLPVLPLCPESLCLSRSQQEDSHLTDWPWHEFLNILRTLARNF